jgi:hypothetical protein
MDGKQVMTKKNAVVAYLNVLSVSISRGTKNDRTGM